MSSGSDLDEDELLKMALKEQALRHVDHQKPSQTTSRPVRNYVQQPANRAVARNANAAPQQRKGINQRRKASMDEDEDSEVEMLSISSGDEDDRGVVQPRNRTASGRDDDKAWDGEEPNCWKRVDEAELARRVREMRDSRAVSAAEKIEAKAAAMARKALNSVQSLPRGMEWVDPLGLGLINHKTFRLISDNVASIPSSINVEPLDPADRAQMFVVLKQSVAKAQAAFEEPEMFLQAHSLQGIV